MPSCRALLFHAFLAKGYSIRRCFSLARNLPIKRARETRSLADPFSVVRKSIQDEQAVL
jgi:hypothetical protein